MFALFGWLRSQVKAAILGERVVDAAELDGGEDGAAIQVALRGRLAALPAPEPEETPARRKRG